MKWTEKHAEYLERQIKRMRQEEKDTDDDEAKEVFRLCRLKLIDLRRPVDR